MSRSTHEVQPGVHVRGVPDYYLYEIPGFLTPAECRDIREAALRTGLRPSEIYGASSDAVNGGARKSSTAWLDLSASLVVRKISELTSELTGLPVSHQEDLQVVRYPPGGFFKPHYDCCEGGPEECKRMNSAGGPRKVTLIVYLNDDFRGGETVFPYVGQSVVPELGKAAVFWSTDDAGNVIEKAFHGGNPVVGGEKWICNKWVHPRPYVL
jgi:prolyl 4-hydroxylase